MRAVLVFAFLFLTALPVKAESPDAIAQELGRACPRGYSVINGKCAPPCAEGAHRNLAGNCVTADGKPAAPVPATCAAGMELVGSECKSECLPKQERDAEGICIAKCPKGAPRVDNRCPGEQGMGFGR